MRTVAVVDVGSNSIRLVIYDVQGRALSPLLNERVSARLGAKLRQTGALDPAGVARARRALSRFRLILKARGVSDVVAVATAAVREASDGAAFVEAASADLGAPLTVLTGPEEGAISARGVLAAAPDARGLVGDLGGRSLELTPIADGAVGRGATSPLGPFAFDGFSLETRKKTAAWVDDVLEASPGAIRARTLHAVGGAWRNLAHIHMTQTDYPLHIVHGYRLGADALKPLTTMMLEADPAEIARIPNISRERVPYLPAAALVLERLARRTKAKSVVFSSYGLREGLIFSRLPSQEVEPDPLISTVETLARRLVGETTFGQRLEAWLAPLSPVLGEAFGAERDAVLRAAACRMSELARRHHPDHRAAVAADEVLAAQLIGLNHPERAFLAKIIAHRYAGFRGVEAAAPRAFALLDEAQRDSALRIGLAMRAQCELTGCVESLFDGVATSLDQAAGALTLMPKPGMAALIGERVEKRFSQFAQATGLSVIVADA